jgi:N-acetylneuraminate synthase
MRNNGQCVVIAEAGVNHNGKLEHAVSLLEAAVVAGADFIKFQTFRAENLASSSATKAQYQRETTDSAESQRDMLRRLELSQQAHYELMSLAEKSKIKFLSTPFDHDSLHFLVNDLGLATLKIPSGEVTNGPLLLDFARSGAELIMSTGMATLADVELALGVLAFGMVSGAQELPSPDGFAAAYRSAEGRQALRDKVSLLHCTTEYPAPVADVNLRAINTLSSAFGLPTGYSDHTAGLEVSIAAVAIGAACIEKHFTLDRSMEGPDHKASLEPAELTQLVSAIRNVELAMGDGIKIPRDSEVKNMAIARKSLVATRDIALGDVWTQEMLTAKRPGAGRTPMSFWDLLGTPATRPYESDEEIE